MKDLERRLNLTAVTAISLSSMLGVSIFVIPGIAVEITGNSAWLSFLIASAVCLPSALAKAELATAMPTSGGTYIYLDRTFGPLVGLISGVGLWLSLLLKTAFALVATGSYLALLGDLPLKGISLSLLAVVMLLNIIGIGKLGAAIVVVVAIILVALLGLSVAGLAQLQTDPSQPFLLHGASGLFLAAAIVFISYSGITKIAAIAEEIKDPKRTLPRSIILSLSIITAFYCLIAYVLSGNLSASELSSNLHPLYTLGHKLGGQYLGWSIAALAVVAMTLMANAGILASSRFPFAMSRDHLIPPLFGRIGQRFFTPTYSILLTGLVTALAIAFLEIDRIVKLASAFLLVIYIAENVTVIVLREMRVHWYKPQYKSPMYPMLQLAGIVFGIGLLLGMWEIIPIAIAAVCVPSFFILYFYSRFRTEKRGVLGKRGRRNDLITASPLLEEINEKLEQEQEQEEEEEEEEEAKVVVLLFGKERSPEMLVEFGIAMAGQEKLEVVRTTEIPEQISANDLPSESTETASLRRRIRTMSKKLSTDIAFEAIYTHDIYKAIHEITSQLHCTWLIKEWGGRTHGAFTVYRQMGWLERHLNCHVLTIRDAGIRYIRQILVFIDPKADNEILINTAAHIARVNEGKLTFVALSPQLPTDQIKEGIDLCLKMMAVKTNIPFKTLVLPGKNAVEEVGTLTVGYDLLIAKAQSHDSLPTKIFGTDIDRLTANSACSVMLIQNVEGRAKPIVSVNNPKSVGKC